MKINRFIILLFCRLSLLFKCFYQVRIEVNEGSSKIEVINGDVTVLDLSDALRQELGGRGLERGQPLTLHTTLWEVAIAQELPQDEDGCLEGLDFASLLPEEEGRWPDLLQDAAL